MSQRFSIYDPKTGRRYDVKVFLTGNYFIIDFPYKFQGKDRIEADINDSSQWDEFTRKTWERFQAGSINTPFDWSFRDNDWRDEPPNGD